MRNAIEFAVSATSTSIAAISTAAQTNEGLQTIQLIVTICAAIVTFLTGVVGLIARIIRWHKKAMEDGKIEDSEWEELSGIIQDGLSEGKTNLDKIKETKKGKKNGSD